MTRPYVFAAVLLVVVLVAIYRRWLRHERQRDDEIRQRERLRVLLRREAPRK